MCILIRLDRSTPFTSPTSTSTSAYRMTPSRAKPLSKTATAPSTSPKNTTSPPSLRSHRHPTPPPPLRNPRSSSGNFAGPHTHTPWTQCPLPTLPHPLRCLISTTHTRASALSTSRAHRPRRHRCTDRTRPSRRRSPTQLHTRVTVEAYTSPRAHRHRVSSTLRARLERLYAWCADTCRM
jgi:hypothetical protein